MEENSENIREKRIKNLKPFQPGESGNPAGRPRGQRGYATIYREALLKLGQLNGKEPDELETEMLSNAVKLARSGDFRFYKDIMDRTHGTAVNKSDITTNGESISTTSDLELELIAAKLAEDIKTKKLS